MMRYALFILVSYFSVSALNAGPALVVSSMPMNCVSHQSDSFIQDTVKRLELNDTVNKDLKGAFPVPAEDEYKIQVGAFRDKSNAESLYERMRKFINLDVKMVVEDGLYKVRISGYPGKDSITQAGEESKPDSSDFSFVGTVSADTLSLNAAIADTVKNEILPSDSPGFSDKVTAEAGKILFVKGDSPWLQRIRYFGKSFTLVNALIVTIIFSITSMLCILVFILLNRNRMERREKLHQYLLEKYQSLIIDYLFGNSSAEDFRPIASDNYRRQVLIDQMIDVSANLKGEESSKLFYLYRQLGLEKDSIDRAFDYRWHKKIKGFRELAFMNIHYANDAIYKALNSKNELLRMEAQIALVRLSDDNHFEFLSYLKRPFSLWEQITLHDLIIQHDLPRPAFRKWLTSTNSSVVLFSLKMIREFNQRDAEELLIYTLKHPSPEVRLLAVQVAGDMGIQSSLDVLKHMYKKENYKICLEIVKSMGKMPDLSMIGFLKLVLDKEDDVQLQIEATKAIENMGEVGVNTLQKLMESEYKNYSIIVKHVLDRRIF